MTAIFYAALVLGAGAVYAFLAWRAIADGAPTWWFVVGVPFVYVALALVLILGWFSVSHLWRGRIPADSRLGFPRYVTMLGRELLTVVTSWPAMALNRFLVQDPVGATEKVPVLLSH